LEFLGAVERSPYYNVVVIKVHDPVALLAAIERRTEESPALYDAISRVAPADCGFEFQSAEEFEGIAKSIVLQWLPRLAGRSFHVRFHRRGSRYALRTPDVERSLDDALLDALQEAGTSGKLSFSDPDAVIVIDTIDDRAGISLWTREDLVRHHRRRWRRSAHAPRPTSPGCRSRRAGSNHRDCTRCKWQTRWCGLRPAGRFPIRLQ
jgi:tRNA(Ser,Leu) C12 N-acetylase TAN1